jgi:hypothetical protein
MLYSLFTFMESFMKNFFLIVMMLWWSWFVPQVSAQVLPENSLMHELLSYDLDAGEERLVVASFLFQAFAVDRVEGVEARYRQGGEWTAWTGLAYEEGQQVGSELVFLATSDAFALRSATDTRVTVTLMNLADSDLQVASLNPIGLSSRSSSSSSEFRIKSRSEWGADESLRTYDPNDVEDDGDDSPSANACEPIETAFPGQYRLKNTVDYFDDRGNNLIWPQRYSQKVKKIVIHHTAQTLRDLNEDGMLNNRDYKLAVQAIYTYHTVSNGWGDVGYQYLVDPDGNVYEGRAGGKDVIGAHVLCQNSNTVGIAVLGNFVEEHLSRKAFEGLVNITQHVSEEYNITPEGKSSFRGTVLPHIVTHAEVGAVTKSFIGRGATQCPGDFLKKEMSQLRQIVADGGFRPALGYELVDKPRRIMLDPLQEYELPLVLKNTGEQMWTSVKMKSKKGSSLVYEESSLTIVPGQNLDLMIPLHVPFKAGKNSTDIQITLNGKRMKNTIPLKYVVKKPKYRYDVVNVESGQKSLLLGEKRSVSVTLKNTSNFPWLDEGKYQVQFREVQKKDENVVAPASGLNVFLSEPVAVGEEMTLSFDVPIQKNEGAYQLQLAPVLGNKKGFRGKGVLLKYSVEKPRFVARLTPKDRRYRPNPGFTEDVEFEILNKGNFDWEAGSVWMELDDQDEVFFVDEEVAVGDLAIISVPIRVGYDDRQVKIKGKLGIDWLPEWLGAHRLSDNSVSIEKKFRSKGRVQLHTEYVAQSDEYLDNASGVHEVWVDLKNTGSVPWYRTGKDRIVLEIQKKADFSHKSWEKRRKMAGFLEQDVVMPGEVGRFSMTLQVKGSFRRTTYDDFLPAVNGKTLRVKKGKVRFGVEGKLKAKPEKEELGESSNFQFLISNQDTSSNDSISNKNEEKGAMVESRELQIPPMRVLLTEIDQDEIKVTASGVFRTWVSSTVQIKEYSAGEEVKILASHVDDGTVIRMRAIGDAHFRFTNWDRIRTFGAGINDNTFRGVLEFRWDADEERMIVINELPLDQYMKGVAEVPETADQPQEKRKVIAVLARSYALHYLISGYEKFPGKPYNAADSPAIFQKYVGQNFETRSPKWQDSLEQTSGEVVLVVNPNDQIPMTNKERVLRAAYFSCTDGERTKSWDEVWPDNEYFQEYGSVFQSVSDPLGDDPGREGMQACGHQVGLSGYGATQKAAQGATYKEIVQDYYQGIEVENYDSL